jgi:exonuclease VII large subunit
MSGSARLTSTAAVQDFQVALQDYQFQTREAIDQLLLEMQRGLDWVEHDRARYWQAEVRNASDGLQQARLDLERCEMAIRAEDRRSCYEQRLAMEQAKQRLRTAEQKIRAVRRWQVAMRREADTLHSRLLKLTDFLDTEFPRGLASLGRILAALERYTEQYGPGSATPAGPGTSTGEADGSTPGNDTACGPEANPP